MITVKVYIKRIIAFTLATVFTVVIAHAQTVIKEPKQIDFSFDYSLGYSTGIGKLKNNTTTFAGIFGAKSNRFFAGIGVGVGVSNAIRFNTIEEELRLGSILFPIYANVKLNLNDKIISPFLSLSAGYTFDFVRDVEVISMMANGTVLRNNDKLSHPGFMIQPNVGVDFKILEWGSIYLLLGFNMQQFEYFCLNSNSDQIITKSEMFKSLDIRLGFSRY